MRTLQSISSPLNAIAEGNALQPAAPKPAPEPVVAAAAEPVIKKAILPEAAPQVVATPVVPRPKPTALPAAPAPTPAVSPAAAEVTSTATAPQVKADTSLRVHVSLLDSLMTLAGELVLSRNQLLQTIGSNDLRNAEAVGQRI